MLVFTYISAIVLVVFSLAGDFMVVTGFLVGRLGSNEWRKR